MNDGLRRAVNEEEEEAETSVSTSTTGQHSAKQIMLEQGNDNDAIAFHIRTLIDKETKAAARWRIVIIALLFVLAILVSLLVRKNVREDELEELSLQYFANAKCIVTSFHTALERQMSAIDAMSTTLTSYAMRNNQKFPFVTMPDFVEKGSDFRILADALSIQWMPLVTEDSRDDWEAYALENRYHVDHDYELESAYRNEQDFIYEVSRAQTTSTSTATSSVLDDGTGYHRRIWSPREGVEKMGRGPYLPLWQQSPVQSNQQSLLNWNIAAENGWSNVLTEIQSTMKGVITQSMVPGPRNLAMPLNNTLSVSQYRENPESYSQVPFAFMAFPVFAEFRKPVELDSPSPGDYDFGYIGGEYNSFQQSDYSDYEEDRHLVGVLGLSLFWGQYFKNILSTTAVGYVGVLENSYNQTFTYRLDGNEVTFVGDGDSHDSWYDHLEVSVDVNSYLQEHASIQTRSYTAIGLSSDFGRYKLRIYPSAATEEAYARPMSKAYIISMTLLFVIVIFGFVSFAILVQRRQQSTMESVIRSGAIASSLQLRQKVHHSSSKGKKKVKFFDATSIKDTSNARMDSANDDQAIRSCDAEVVNNDTTATADLSTTCNSVGLVAIDAATDLSTMADVHAEATIMFSDIVGFSSWSARHPPVAIFELLATVFNAFDDAAKKRRVVKVDTVGDCYLAVAGIQVTQEDHAVVMTMFAQDCVTSLTQVVQQLSTTLGPDTASLQLRVGLHSGPVIAGILRGQNSRPRFQLFGKTVHLASQIEATSRGGKIQISQSTADELILRGKSHWFTPRKDRIRGKGKGEMVTYWVTNYDEKCDDNNFDEKVDALDSV